MSENRIECPLCRTGTYPHFGYTGSGVCDHCGAEWTYDETDTLTDNAMRALWDKIPRWIPVTERLPEKPCKVLACGFQKHPVVCSFGWIAPLGNDIPEFRDGGPVRGVTHWMPLPAPPQTGK